MGLSAVLAGIMRIIDIAFGLLGLLLILRIILELFKVSSQNPIMRILAVITNPVIYGVERLLGLDSHRYTIPFNVSSNLLMLLVAVVTLWATHTVIGWVFELINFIPLLISSPLKQLGSLIILLVRILFELYGLALLVRILFEWLRVSYASRVMRFLWDITEPLLAPLRRAIPPFGGLDFSPVIAFFLLRLLEQIVFAMLSWIF